MFHVIQNIFKVALASGKIVSWSWERNAEEMRTLCCGLGMTAVVLAVTFKCIPLQRFVNGLLRNVTFPQPYITFYLRFTEISYLCSIRDVLGQWGIQLKSSYCQQLLWFPFSELTVMTHLNPTEKYNMVRKEFLGQLR